jgi:hypothetical protein
VRQDNRADHRDEQDQTGNFEWVEEAAVEHLAEGHDVGFDSSVAWHRAAEHRAGLPRADRKHHLGEQDDGEDNPERRQHLLPSEKARQGS